MGTHYLLDYPKLYYIYTIWTDVHWCLQSGEHNFHQNFFLLIIGTVFLFYFLLFILVPFVIIQMVKQDEVIVMFAFFPSLSLSTSDLCILIIVWHELFIPLNWRHTFPLLWASHYHLPSRHLSIFIISIVFIHIHNWMRLNAQANTELSLSLSVRTQFHFTFSAINLNFAIPTYGATRTFIFILLFIFIHSWFFSFLFLYRFQWKKLLYYKYDMFGHSTQAPHI